MNTPERRSEWRLVLDGLVPHAISAARASEFDRALIRYLVDATSAEIAPEDLSLPEPDVRSLLNVDGFGVTRAATLGFLIATGEVDDPGATALFIEWLRRCTTLKPPRVGPSVHSEPRLLLGLVAGSCTVGTPPGCLAWLDERLAALVETPPLAERVLAWYGRSRLSTEGAWARFERALLGAEPRDLRDIVACAWGIYAVRTQVSAVSQAALDARAAEWINSINWQTVSALGAQSLAFGLVIAGHAAASSVATARPRSDGAAATNLPEARRPLRPAVGPSSTVSIRRERVVLAVATEWESHHGGLTTFNRELCCALQRGGVRVFCLVPTATDAELRAAARHGINLLPAQTQPGQPEEAWLYGRPALPTDIVPSVVIGHGRVTGPAAAALVQNYFPTARRVHVIHTAPGEIEWFKTQAARDAASTAEEREQLEVQLGRSAAAIFAVGPRLHREFRTHIHDRSVHRLDPGCADMVSASLVPAAVHCLLLGRAEDHELKGLDIAARAVALQRFTGPEDEPILIIRGAVRDTGANLRDLLLSAGGRPGMQVRVKNFTGDQDRIADDLLRSSVVLMPSRAEGFGLVGLEAIGVGVPVLVSDQSGLGELLRSVAPDAAKVAVVPVTGKLEIDGAEWAKRLGSLLLDRDAAFRRAEQLRATMRGRFTWDAAASTILETLG